MLGRTFGELTVVSPAESVREVQKRNGKMRTVLRKRWLCRCSCGDERVVLQNQLQRTTACRKCAVVSGASAGGRSRKGAQYGPSAAVLSKPKGQFGFKTLFKTYQYHAAARGYEWSLSEAEFRDLTSRSCFYCGQEPSQRSGHQTSKYAQTAEHNTYIYNGVDRWDNSQGYRKENCVTCCGRCNTMKMDLDGPEFIQRIKAIFEWMSNKDNNNGDSEAAA